MCTLTFTWQTFAEAPLVVAANRDELYTRPSRPPGRVDDEPPLVAPRDEEAGGTWIGYNRFGLFAGITNRWVEGREGERSRGQLMRDVLRRPTAAAAARLVEREVDDRVYDGFNLVVADGAAGLADPGSVAPPTDADREDPVAAVLLEYDGSMQTRTLEPGVHVVVNVGADGEYVLPAGRQEAGERQAENADRLREHLRPDPGETAATWRDRAREAVGNHNFGACVHGDGFGTVSSSLLMFGEGGVEYGFARGPPCETAFEPVDARPHRRS